MKFLHKALRSNFYVYRLFRHLAPFLCRYLILEDGFRILSNVHNDFSQNRVLVDVGSNDGTSIAMMRQYFPKHLICGFEPILPIPKHLLKLQNSRLLEWNTVALGEKSRTIKIFTPIIRGKSFSQFSSANKDWITFNLNKFLNFGLEGLSFAEREIQVETLDSFGLTPFFIKIDVEGSELSVLKGSKRTISIFKPIVLIEINDEKKFMEIELFMHSQSYSLIFEREFIKEQNNYIFVHDDNVDVFAHKKYYF